MILFKSKDPISLKYTLNFYFYKEFCAKSETVLEFMINLKQFLRHIESENNYTKETSRLVTFNIFNPLRYNLHLKYCISYLHFIVIHTHQL